MQMSLELFIGKKKQKSSSELIAESEKTQLRESKDISDSQLPPNEKISKKGSRSSSRMVTDLMIKDINLEELQKYSNLEILHFLTSAVREHPLYAHYL